MRLGYNMLGQSVDMDADLASGYYLFDNPEDAEVPGGCGDLRPGVMVLGGGVEIPTCGGNLNTEYLPDMILIDDWFKVAVTPMAIGAIVLLLIAIYKVLK